MATDTTGHSVLILRMREVRPIIFHVAYRWRGVSARGCGDACVCSTARQSGRLRDRSDGVSFGARQKLAERWGEIVESCGVALSFPPRFSHVSLSVLSHLPSLHPGTPWSVCPDERKDNTHKRRFVVTRTLG